MSLAPASDCRSLRLEAHALGRTFEPRAEPTTVSPALTPSPYGKHLYSVRRRPTVVEYPADHTGAPQVRATGAPHVRLMTATRYLCGFAATTAATSKPLPEGVTVPIWSGDLWLPAGAGGVEARRFDASERLFSLVYLALRRVLQLGPLLASQVMLLSLRCRNQRRKGAAPALRARR